MRKLLLLLVVIGTFPVLAQDSTRIKPSFAFYPAIGYSPETKLQLGAIGFIVFENNDSVSEFKRPTSLSPYVIYSTNKQLSIAVDVDAFFKHDLNLNADFKYSDYPDYYFGIGNETTPDSSEQYTRRLLFTKGRLMKAFTPRLFAGLQFDLGNVNMRKINSGGMLKGDQPTGIEGGWVMGLGLGGIYDSRNNVLYPTKGKFVQVGSTFYSKAFGSAYEYTSINLDYRQYFTFLWPGSVLAIQGRADFTIGEVPFFDLSEIGGDDQLRGIANGNLYNDHHAMYFQVEGRQHLFWRFGGVLFTGVGQSFSSFSEMDGDHTRFVYGLGGRFQAIHNQPLNIRVDFGFTDNGQNAFYVTVKEAF